MYRYTDDVRHDHVTLSKFANRAISLHKRRLHLLPSEGLGAPLAKSPEVLKPKEKRIGQFFITDL